MTTLRLNLAAPFIRRPVAASLMAIGILLVGLVCYRQLGVASLPPIDLPTIRVSAAWPGADPETMAASVTAPLEKHLGALSGVTELTSTSGNGQASITVQFDLRRNVDRAAQDVQAAINAAMVDLPSDMPSPPSFRKANPNNFPVLILALTSPTLSTADIYDAADTVLVQRLSQVSGVGEVSLSGADQPAIRVEVNPAAVAAAGFSLEQIRQAIVAANTVSPLGSFDGPRQAESIRLNAQLSRVEAYRQITLRSPSGTVVRLTDIAEVSQGVRNSRASGSYDGRPAVLITITRAANANVLETVGAIKAMIPELKRWLPADMDIHVMSDRTVTLNASIADMQATLVMSIAMVMAIVFLFLGRIVPTLAAAVTIPLAFAGAFFGMWLVGFTIDNLSLMALAIAVGFIVDDAIVVIESVMRRMEQGVAPFEAAIEAAGRIAPTVITISLALVTAFAPLFFMDGMVGRFMREFAGTIAFAVAASTFVALTVTPMILAHRMRQSGVAGEQSATMDPHLDPPPSWGRKGATPSPSPARGGPGRGHPSAAEPLFQRLVSGLLARLTNAYLSSLRVALRFGPLLILVMIGSIGLTVHLWRSIPKGYFPQDDTGLLMGWTEAAPDVSFEAMRDLQERAAAIIARDPAVAHVGSFLGSQGWVWGGNSGRLFVSLKPLSERRLPARRVIDRIKRAYAEVPGISVYLWPVQDVRAGGRQSKSEMQFTLWGADIGELRAWAPKVAERLKQIDGLTDVNTDLDEGSLQLRLEIDRDAAARLGVSIASINAALNNVFSQRQIVTLFSERNQYRVVMAATQRGNGDPSAIDRVFVPARDGKQVPLGTLVTRSMQNGPLTVSHQGAFPSVTVSYGLKTGLPIGTANAAIRAAVDGMHLPEGLQADFAGDAAAANRSAAGQVLLILGTLVAIYILLGVLYESLAHPLTILSTLPSASLGALLALKAFRFELSVVAMIGIILLIGLVMKNGIMLVDRAIEAERAGATPREAIIIASADRFRPILMTTLAAMLGALPFLIAEGPGSELRRPLGVTITGGLALSQVLTLYTTPAIYLGFEWLKRRLARLRGRPAASPQPAE